MAKENKQRQPLVYTVQVTAEKSNAERSYYHWLSFSYSPRILGITAYTAATLAAVSEMQTEIGRKPKYTTTISIRYEWDEYYGQNKDRNTGNRRDEVNAFPPSNPEAFLNASARY